MRVLQQQQQHRHNFVTEAKNSHFSKQAPVTTTFSFTDPSKAYTNCSAISPLLRCEAHEKAKTQSKTNPVLLSQTLAALFASDLCMGYCMVLCAHFIWTSRVLFGRCQTFLSSQGEDAWQRGAGIVVTPGVMDWVTSNTSSVIGKGKVFCKTAYN